MNLWRLVCLVGGHRDIAVDYEIPSDGGRRLRYETCGYCKYRWRAA